SSDIVLISHLFYLSISDSDSKCNANEELQSDLTERSILYRQKHSVSTIIFSCHNLTKLFFVSFKIDLHKNLKPSELDSLLPDATCPDEWLKFNCSCYQISGNGSWDEGREHCMRKGGDLVVINNPEEQNFLAEFEQEAWIGLSDRETEGSWLWVDGTALSFIRHFNVCKCESLRLCGQECVHIQQDELLSSTQR
uniref:C-type lectin domain-containing protein n=1 Tax=Xiphophorus couchianus TaxID=32473 RepID=A0A3B5MMP7_9TELE